MSLAQGSCRRLESARVVMASRRRLSQALRKVATLRLPDSLATGDMPASVADLAQERSGGEGRVGVAKEREEDLAVGMGSHSTGDARFKQPDLLDDRTQSGEQREHCSPARRLLCHLCPSPGGSSQ